MLNGRAINLGLEMENDTVHAAGPSGKTRWEIRYAHAG